MKVVVVPNVRVDDVDVTAIGVDGVAYLKCGTLYKAIGVPVWEHQFRSIRKKPEWRPDWLRVSAVDSLGRLRPTYFVSPRLAAYIVMRTRGASKPDSPAFRFSRSIIARAFGLKGPDAVASDPLDRTLEALHQRIELLEAEIAVRDADLASRDAEARHRYAIARRDAVVAGMGSGSDLPSLGIGAGSGPAVDHVGPASSGAKPRRRGPDRFGPVVPAVLSRVELVLADRSGAIAPGQVCAGEAVHLLVRGWGEDGAVFVLSALKANASRLALTTTAIRPLAGLHGRWAAHAGEPWLAEAIAAMDFDALGAAAASPIPFERLSAVRRGIAERVEAAWRRAMV